jgi:hypothetical protein
MLGSAGPGSGHLPFGHPLRATGGTPHDILFAKIRGPLPHLHRPEASKFLTKNGEWKEEEDQKKEEKQIDEPKGKS